MHYGSLLETITTIHTVSLMVLDTSNGKCMIVQYNIDDRLSKHGLVLISVSPNIYI